MGKEETIQKVLSATQAFEESRLGGQEYVEQLVEMMPYLVSLSGGQREAIQKCFEDRPGLSALYPDNFPLFLQLYCGVFPLPPYAEKEPRALASLFKSSSARYQLLEMEAMASQLPAEQQLFLGIKIAEAIALIRREKDEKLHLFTEWYLILLQIGQRGVKLAVEKAQRGEPYEHHVRAVGETLKRALSAARVDRKTPGLLCPGQPGQAATPALLLRHYALLFAFDITEGLLNLEQHPEVHEAAYHGLRIVLHNFVKDLYSPQEVFENYAVMRSDASAGFNPSVGYNAAGVSYFLSRYLASEAASFLFTAEYRLKLLLPALAHSLRQKKQIPKYHEQLIDLASQQLLLLRQPLSNLNEFMTPLDAALEPVYDYVGGVQRKDFQDRFVAAFEHLCQLMDDRTLTLLFEGLFKLTSNGSLLGHLLQKVKKHITAREKLSAAECPLVSRARLEKMLACFLSKNSSLAVTDKTEELGYLANLLVYLRTRGKSHGHKEAGHVLSGAPLLEQEVGGLLKDLGKGLEELAFKLSTLRQRKEQERNPAEEDRLEQKVERVRMLAGQLEELKA